MDINWPRATAFVGILLLAWGFGFVCGQISYNDLHDRILANACIGQESQRVSPECLEYLNLFK